MSSEQNESTSFDTTIPTPNGSPSAKAGVLASSQPIDPLLDVAGQESSVAPTHSVLPKSPSQVAHFGELGRLRPVPGKLTGQPTETLAQVPDTAIEWLDHTDPKDPNHTLSLRGVSVRGHIHRWEGSVRQDQLAVGSVGGNWVAAVSDGLGSQPQSHLGAVFASRFVVSWPLVDQILRTDETVFSCAEVASVLRFAAQQRGLDPRTLSATLTFAVVASHAEVDENGYPHWRVAVVQIGDCNAYLLRDGRWTKVTQGDASAEADSALTNVVDPLPSHTEGRVWRLKAEPGDVLALMSDGVWTALEDVPSYGEALAAQWQASPPTPAALLYVLDAAVRSYDDDRTFVGIRFGAQ